MSAFNKIFSYHLTVFSFLLLPVYCFSNHISGVISNQNGEPLPFASVYIKNTTYGVSSNAFGEYFIELKPGKYTIVYSYIGFKSKEKIITLNDVAQNINITLNENDQNLIEYEVVSNTKNKALKIIEEVKKEKEINKRSNQEVPYVFIIAVLMSGIIGLFASSLVLSIFSTSGDNSVKEELIKSN